MTADSLNRSAFSAPDANSTESMIIYGHGENTTTCAIDIVTQSVIGTCITSFGMVCNIAFMFVIFRVASMRTVTNAYLVNLAIADLLHSVSHSVIWNCFLIDGPGCFYFENNNTCAFLFLSRVPQYVSMFTITMLSVERYLALCKPLVYRGGVIHDKRFVGTVIILTWVVSVMITIEGLIDCIHMEAPESRSVAGRIVYLVSVFVLLVITIVLYGFIIHRVRQSDHSVKKNEKQIIRVCLSTALVYFVCTMPAVLQASILVLNHYGLIALTEDLVSCLTNASTFLLEINSSLNPVIYNALSSIYRRAFRKAFCCKQVKCWTSYFKIKRRPSENTEMTEWNHTNNHSKRSTLKVKD